MTTIMALHGFLGLPKDWDHFNVIPYKISSAQGFHSWAKEFNAWVETSISGPRILMGYSMGGRLALHALLDKPSLWTKGVLISTHPGLKDQKGCTKRLQSDRGLADQFRTHPWDQLMEMWENQPVFKDASIRPIRREEDYEREVLANHLENFSLGKQENLLPQLAALSIPLRWITGAKDLSFAALANEAVTRNSSHFSIPDGSHRVHLEFPEIIKKEL